MMKVQFAELARLVIESKRKKGRNQARFICLISSFFACASAVYGKMKIVYRKRGMDMISKEEVAHVAQLARLEFTDAELEQYTGQLDEILNMVDQLSTVDTEGVPATTQNVMLENVMRADVATFVTPRAELMKNAPTEKDGLLQVPAIIAKEEA